MSLRSAGYSKWAINNPSTPDADNGVRISWTTTTTVGTTVAVNVGTDGAASALANDNLGITSGALITPSLGSGQYLAVRAHMMSPLDTCSANLAPVCCIFCSWSAFR